MTVRIIKLTLRGCRALPFVGPHPGTAALILLCLLGLLAGGIVGAIAVLGIFGPVYLYGAYDRAKLSEKCERPRKKRYDPIHPPF